MPRPRSTIWASTRARCLRPTAPGIETTLTLAPDGSYALHLKYIDRDSEFDEKGAFTVKENLLTLTPSEGGQPQYYKVEENRLRRLDARKTTCDRRAGGQLHTAKNHRING